MSILKSFLGICCLSFFSISSFASTSSENDYAKGCLNNPDGCLAFVITRAASLPNFLPAQFSLDFNGAYLNNSSKPTVGCGTNRSLNPLLNTPVTFSQSGESWSSVNSNVADAICNCTATSLLYGYPSQWSTESSVSRVTNMLGIEGTNPVKVNQPNYFKGFLLASKNKDKGLFSIPAFKFNVPNKTSKNYYFFDKGSQSLIKNFYSYYELLNYIYRFSGTGSKYYPVYTIMGENIASEDFLKNEGKVIPGSFASGLVLGSESMFYAGNTTPTQATCSNFDENSVGGAIAINPKKDPPTTKQISCDSTSYFIMCLEPQIYKPSN